MCGKHYSTSMGKWAVCFLLLFLCRLTYAQETIVRYVKKGGYTEHRDSADYIREVDISTNEQGLYTLNEYYPNGTLKRHGALQSADPQRLIFEGLVESYFSNGNVASILNYSDNHLIDTAQWFYKNGILKTKKVYYRKNSDLPDGVNSLLIYHADSTGNIQVQDGNGQAQFINANTEIEQGAYSDGLRVGHWEGSFQKGKYRFEEYYENGKLIRGISTDSLGNEYPYSEIYIQPDYPGGDTVLRTVYSSKFQLPRGRNTSKYIRSTTDQFCYKHYRKTRRDRSCQ